MPPESQEIAGAHSHSSCKDEQTVARGRCDAWCGYVAVLALARAYAVQGPQRGPHRLANLQEISVIWHAAELV